METIERAIEVNVPLREVYNQWTQFEEFPKFMEGVKEVRQLDDKRLHWRAEIAGKEKEWDAEIFEQIPDRRIAWRSMRGVMNSGMVNFTALTPTTTLVTLALHYQPASAMENIGSMLGLVAARVTGDLRRFKEFIELRTASPGSWRGEIHGKDSLSSQ